MNELKVGSRIRMKSTKEVFVVTKVGKKNFKFETENRDAVGEMRLKRFSETFEIIPDVDNSGSVMSNSELGAFFKALGTVMMTNNVPVQEANERFKVDKQLILASAVARSRVGMILHDGSRIVNRLYK